jgi:hypothetical protein
MHLCVMILMNIFENKVTKNVTDVVIERIDNAEHRETQEFDKRCR